MIYKDRIYGKVNIKEPVLLELLTSPSILRLKKISQFGVPDKYYTFKNFSRYEHSIGVMILLRKLGATLEEQVAGLLHDVSIPAFSHVVDWVFGEGKEGVENFHEDIHNEFIENTEIPKIIKKHNFSLERILDSDNFTLLEKLIPDLCADRVDYAFREFKDWLNPSIIKSCMNSLVNFNAEIVFNNKKNAFDFASNFLELQNKHWGLPDTSIRFYHFSEIFKVALDKKIISYKDFFKDEDIILDKIEKSSETSLQKILKKLEKGNVYKNLKRTGKKVFKKFRHVDPKIIIDGELVRLSKINSKFKKTLEKHRKINKKGILV